MSKTTCPSWKCDICGERVTDNLRVWQITDSRIVRLSMQHSLSGKCALPRGVKLFIDYLSHTDHIAQKPVRIREVRKYIRSQR